MHALQMQRVYAREGNRLHLDYAGHVHRIWIGEVTFTMEPYNFSILAPVLLASKSLAVDFRSPRSVIISVLQWGINSPQYPVWASLLPAMATSVSSESAVSHDKRRNHLNADVVEVLQCLNFMLKQGLLFHEDECVYSEDVCTNGRYIVVQFSYTKPRTEPEPGLLNSIVNAPCLSFLPRASLMWPVT
jgi:hypothetical protein